MRRYSSTVARNVLGGTATYAAAAAIQRAAPLLLLPLFTRVFTPGEYGQVGVIATATACFSLVAGLGLETATLRAYVQASDDTRARATLVNTLGAFAVVVPMAVATLAAIVIGGASSFLGVPVSPMQIALFGAAALTSATIVPMAVLRAQARFDDYLRLATVNVLITSILTISLVMVLGLGVLGWVLGYTIGNVTLLVVGLIVLRHRWTREFDAASLRRALGFGVPLVPHFAAHWGLALSDRLVLGALVASAAIAPYYVAYQLCGPITVLAGAISQATQPAFAAARSLNEREQLARTSTAQALLVCMTAAAVALLGPPIIRLALPASYASAVEYLPWMALGIGFYGLYLIPMNAIAVMAGRTQMVWVVTAAAAACNILLNLIFVPQIGPVAAAIDTAIGYAILLLGVWLYMIRVVPDPIPFEGARLAAGVSVIVVTVWLAMIVTPPDAWIALAVAIGALGAAGLVLVRMMFRREFQIATSIIRSRARARAQ